MSSEDLKSLIVTDPDIVDEGIDVSGLRTQTDTDPRLLASIADFPGISYDPTEFSYLSDLNELFAYGLPTTETAEAVTPPATGEGGSGGGGQAITPTTSITDGTNINTPEDQRLIDEGIGLQIAPGQPVFAPGEMPVTQAEMDAFNRTPVTPVTPSGQPIDPTGMLPQTSTPFMVEGALGVDPREKQDFITEEDAADPGFLSKIGLGQFNPAEALVKTAINTAIGKPVTFLIDFLKNNLPPQDPRQTELNKLYDVQDGTIQSGLMKGYNPVSGGGLYTLTGGRAGEEPTYGLQEAYQDRIDTIENTLADKYGMTAAEIADVKAGTYAGDVDTELFDRLNQLETDKAKEKARLDLFSGDIQETGDASIAEQLYDADRLGISGDIGVEGEDEGRFDAGAKPTNSITDGTNITTDITSDQINEFDTTPIDEFSDEEFMVGDTSTAAPTGGDSGAGSFFDAVDRSVTGTTKPGTSTQPTYTDAIMRGQSGGGSDSSGGSTKIVCTMMNESYGFGSFRNKIWLKHSKGLALEYQKGYHKIFLPLVRLSKKNIVLKKILEHIAVHRTIDIRQEARGKMHLLGRVYRKILEPICYLVGKYAK